MSTPPYGLEDAGDGLDVWRARALLALRRHGPFFDAASVASLLSDRDLVRVPMRLVFDGGPLADGELARVVPRSATEVDLHVHPLLEGRWDLLPALVAEQLVHLHDPAAVGDSGSEAFGETLLRLERGEFARLLAGVRRVVERG